MIDEIFNECRSEDSRSIKERISLDVPEEELEDFSVALDGLDSESQQLIEAFPAVIDILPAFVQKWTVQELWSAIRDR